MPCSAQRVSLRLRAGARSRFSGADDAVALAAQALRDAGILPVLGLDLTAADSRLESLADHVGPALFAAIGLRQDLRAAAGTWQAGVVALADPDAAHLPRAGALDHRCRLFDMAR